MAVHKTIRLAVLTAALPLLAICHASHAASEKATLSPEASLLSERAKAGAGLSWLKKVAGVDHGDAIKLIAEQKISKQSVEVIHLAASASSKITIRPDLVLEAAGRGVMRYLEAALAKGANPNASTSDGTTPLMRAAASGRTDAARILLAAGALPALANKRGENALDLAIRKRHAGTAAVIIGSLPKDMLNETMVAKIVGTAVATCDAATIVAVAKSGIRFQALDVDGRTPLMLAAAQCGGEALREILPLTTDIDAADNKGRTALIHAARHGNTQAVSALILAGANADNADGDGQTSLTVAIRNRAKDVVSILLGAAQQIDARTARGNTALLIAANAGDAASARALLSLHAAVDLANKHGVTPLIAASVRGHAEIAGLLLQADAALDVRDQTSKSAEDWAKAAQQSEVLNQLTRRK